jgi:CubicO group peptidase (beta-lactamase class C family)
LHPGHLFPAPGATSLVTGTAVLRLAAEGRLDLDAPANDKLRTVRLADDAVTVRDLLTHTGGVDSPSASAR